MVILGYFGSWAPLSLPPFDRPTSGGDFMGSLYEVLTPQSETRVVFLGLKLDFRSIQPGGLVFGGERLHFDQESISMVFSEAFFFLKKWLGNQRHGFIQIREKRKQVGKK